MRFCGGIEQPSKIKAFMLLRFHFCCFPERVGLVGGRM